MMGIQAFIVISIVLVALVTYSALAASSKQGQRMVQRIKTDHQSKKPPYSPAISDSFTFEMSEELDPEKDDDFDDLADF